MSQPNVIEIVCDGHVSGDELRHRLATALAGEPVPDWIVVRSVDVDVDRAQLDSLLHGGVAPLAASASPVPLRSGGRSAATIPVHLASPPPAPVPLPCLDLCAISTEALRSLPHTAMTGTTWRAALAAIGQQLTNSGWRHVVSPELALAWSGPPTPAALGAGWSEASVHAAMDAQPSLEALRLWAQTRCTGLRVVIDGACVSNDIHNGTQVVVLQLCRAMAAVRPDARVALAVRGDHLATARRLVHGSAVEVVARRSGEDAEYDVAYRPYQSIDPSELGWLVGAGRRVLVGQLDMIAFSNPSYHPSPELFHTVRNLQRHMMRSADGVTFISRFGRDTAAAECPEIPVQRLHVVGCGVDVASHDGDAGPPPTTAPSFVACLSATFHHKNRTHAIRTFAAMCQRHGYEGSLVIAGPEPFYGRADEDDVVAGIPDHIASRVERLGHVDVSTKWWLLRHADLVLYPSVVEGFGLVPFEAAAVGTPSLSYHGTGLHEVLADPNVLVASWDPDVWAARAIEVVTDHDRRAAAVDAVIAAGARHSWADVARRTWDVIDTTVAMPSSQPVDEGSTWSHVSPSRRSTQRLAPARHLAVRVVAAVRRRVLPVVDKQHPRR